jgi:hypothetical protein
VQPEDLGNFLRHLTDAQRAAITTFKIGNSMSALSLYDISRWIIRHHFSKRQKSGDPFFHWSGLRDLLKLSGLKWVVVGNQYFVEYEEYKELDTDKVTAEIKDLVGDRDICIDFEDPLTRNGLSWHQKSG